MNKHVDDLWEIVEKYCEAGLFGEWWRDPNVSVQLRAMVNDILRWEQS